MTAASSATARAAVIFGSCASDHFLNPLVPLFIEIHDRPPFLKERMQYMGMILEIVLNYFAIFGAKISSHLFQAIEFTRKQRDDFFNLITGEGKRA